MPRFASDAPSTSATIAPLTLSPGLSTGKLVAKRLTDVSVAVVAIALLSPLLALRAQGRRTGRLSLRGDLLDGFVHVLRGDLSLVGPSALTYGESDDGRMIALRPGLVGLVHALGVTAPTPAENRRVDRYYARTWSPVVDVVVATRAMRHFVALARA